MSIASKLMMMCSFVLVTASAAIAHGEVSAPADESSDTVALAGPPGSWSLGDKERWKKLQAELDQYVNLVNESCKTKITVTFAYESFRGQLEDQWPYKGKLTSAITTVRQQCLDSDDGKQAVAAKIGTIVLALTDDKAKHSLSSKKLSVAVPPKANPRDWQGAFAKFLKDSL